MVTREVFCRFYPPCGMCWGRAWTNVNLQCIILFVWVYVIIIIYNMASKITRLLAVHWYAIGCGLFGCLGVVVGLTACAYQCYRRRRPDATTRLSAAIHKGLSESRPSRETVLRRSSSAHSSGSTSRSSGTLMKSPEAPMKDSYIGGGDRATDLKTEYHLEHEQRDNKHVDAYDKNCDENRHADDLGTLEFAVAYDEPKSALVVSIVRACALPAKDPIMRTSDPYVKLQLLPERRHKAKTRVVRKTTNPTYDEEFTFYGLDANQLAATTLHFVVLSFDRFSRDDIIGEVVYPLAEVDLAGEGSLAVVRSIAPRHIKVGSTVYYRPGSTLNYRPAQ